MTQALSLQEEVLRAKMGFAPTEVALFGPLASGRPSPTSEKGVGAGRRRAQKRQRRPISNRRRDGGTGQTGNEFTLGCSKCPWGV